MADWIKILLGSTALTALIGFIGRLAGWRFNPKEKVDVRKVESNIKIDQQDIHSKQIDDEIKVSQQALEWTAQFAAQLEKANAVIDKLQQELERMRALNEKIREDYGRQIDELENSLELEKRHCHEIQSELDKIKKLYNIL